MNRPVAPGDDTGDARARRAAAEDLDRDLFLEAGAGTGKTTALVARIMALVRSGVALSSVAAITFHREGRRRVARASPAGTRRGEPSGRLR